MSGINRDLTRVKANSEVFTPTKDVQRYLDLLPQELFSDPNENFLDYACGDGQFLGEVLIRKLESLGKEEITDAEFEQALSTIYGVDLMIDNVDKCREHLLCGREDLRHIVEKNIVCYNALEYDYKFSRRKMKEVKQENNARKKAERARKKAEREEEAKKMQLEKLAKEETPLKRLYGKVIPEIGKTGS